MRRLAGILVGLSLVVVGVAEGSHTHDDAGDSPAACSVCELAHKAGPAVSSGMLAVSGLSLVQGPALRGRQLNVRAAHLSPHRSRAPPLPISL